MSAQQTEWTREHWSSMALSEQMRNLALMAALRAILAEADVGCANGIDRYQTLATIRKLALDAIANNKEPK